jgi:hypothetical protein
MLFIGTPPKQVTLQLPSNACYQLRRYRFFREEATAAISEHAFRRLPVVEQARGNASFICLDSTLPLVYDSVRIPVALGRVSLKQD